MMAAGVLKGSGLDDAERSKAKEAWLDLPGNSNITAKTGLTRRQMLQLKQLAANRHINPDVRRLIQQALLR